jgi:hypothetical protein
VARQSGASPDNVEVGAMLDAFFLALGVLSFVVLGQIARACDRT